MSKKKTKSAHSTYWIENDNIVYIVTYTIKFSNVIIIFILCIYLDFFFNFKDVNANFSLHIGYI